MSFLIGQTVGDYAILEELGGGGFGRVYKVEHTLTRRREAMKVLAVGEANSTDQSERFLREIRLQASLNHPNIATVLNAFWTDDHVVLISELLEGEPLKNLLDRGRLPFTQALDIMSQVLAALSYAQARGVIHRDVSPGNIFVTANSGPVKLIDFGLAKAAADLHVTQGGPVGSVHYMSPEQVQGLQTLDSRTDIYSCGAILYELATGQKLFDGESGFEIMQAHVGQPPRAPKSVDPAIPPLLEEIILRAVAKKPEERFQSADSFCQAVQQVRRELDFPIDSRRSVPAHSQPPRLLIWATGVPLTIALFVGAARWVPRGKVQLTQAQIQAVPPAPAAAIVPQQLSTKPSLPVSAVTPARPSQAPHPVTTQKTDAATVSASTSTETTQKSPIAKIGGAFKRLNPFGRKAKRPDETPAPE
jgi:serine/threonine-protein kinase